MARKLGVELVQSRAHEGHATGREVLPEEVLHLLGSCGLHPAYVAVELQDGNLYLGVAIVVGELLERLGRLFHGAVKTLYGLSLHAS